MGEGKERSTGAPSGQLDSSPLHLATWRLQETSRRLWRHGPTRSVDRLTASVRRDVCGTRTLA